ncbi:hypothetical protein J422_01480 [Methanocaldococcus villosus KIN24-T80]|uniref:Uncharacterized protein n=1 Tax=Methanocaldococcus villosus KIN24-T80 TaxID=1069083 RepID=N6VZT9_9EURY|nr:hypothetical protein [Methanocaldococcus villosus]ENN96592.1 hypothetical protein J422_01480 [Methanocaldococcus villosus KIN24-T80]
MDYDKLLKRLKDKDGITVGAYYTGDWSLYLMFIFGSIIVGRIYGNTMMVIISLMSLALLFSVPSLIFHFKKENSNNINTQLFWFSIFLGALALIIFIAKVK